MYPRVQDWGDSSETHGPTFLEKSMKISRDTVDGSEIRLTTWDGAKTL